MEPGKRREPYAWRGDDREKLYHKKRDCTFWAENWEHINKEDVIPIPGTGLHSSWEPVSRRELFPKGDRGRDRRPPPRLEPASARRSLEEIRLRAVLKLGTAPNRPGRIPGLQPGADPCAFAR